MPRCFFFILSVCIFFLGKQFTIQFYAAESFATKPKERRHAMVHEDIVINITRLSLVQQSSEIWEGRIVVSTGSCGYLVVEQATYSPPCHRC